MRAPPLVLLLASVLAASPLAGAPRAQTAPTVTIANGNGLTIKVGQNGLQEIAAGGDVFAFEDVSPFWLQTTDLSGAQATWRDVAGTALTVATKTVTQLSPTRCAVAWRACALPNVGGTCDLVWLYEVLPGEEALTLHGTVENSSLTVGLTSVSYRQYLQSSATPESVTGGFTGAIHVAFDQLPTTKWNHQHPMVASHGTVSLGLGTAAAEHFIATRTSETHLVAATHHGDRTRGLLIARDSRRDPDNVARELAFFGANAPFSTNLQFGFGCASLLPNDQLPANGGASPLPVGSGLRIDLFPRENTADPYWDVVRAYRRVHVDPLLAGTNKRAERPDWAGHAVYVAVNVNIGGVVGHGPAGDFLDEFLGTYDQVTDVSFLMWNATDLQNFQPLPGLDQLTTRVQAIAQKHRKHVHTGLYYLPTWYTSDATGGQRLNQVALDPFGWPARFQIATGEFFHCVDVTGTAAKRWFQQWLDGVVGPAGVSNLFFDDGFRHRTFFAYAYNADDAAASLAPVGRTANMVQDYFWHMRTAADWLRGHQRASMLVTELGTIGKSIPGNLLQGIGGLQGAGPFFVDPQAELEPLPFLNDVAGHHFISGYAGTLGNEWIEFADYANVPYYAAQVVRGLVPMVTPVAMAGRYCDFFQACRYVVDCNKPRFRPLSYCSQFANLAIGFRGRHEPILSNWLRQPLPGTHDIGKRVLQWEATHALPSYRLSVDATPFGYFQDPQHPQSFALAIANPLETASKVRFKLARDRYGMKLQGGYTITMQLGVDPKLTVVPHTSTPTDIDFTIDLPGLQFAMLRLDPTNS